MTKPFITTGTTKRLATKIGTAAVATALLATVCSYAASAATVRPSATLGAASTAYVAPTTASTAQIAASQASSTLVIKPASLVSQEASRAASHVVNHLAGAPRHGATTNTATVTNSSPNRHRNPVPTPTTTTTVPATTTTTAPATPFPVGTVNSAEPSGMAPPSTTALTGFTQSYVSDFTGTALDSTWDVYSGQPGGDPGAQFGGASHVAVNSGMLQLLTYQDANYNNEWVTGGLCQCNFQQTYGAYFVRSRATGAGPTQVELLWPSAPVWPPEIDFNETYGGTDSTTATTHWGSANSQAHASTSIDMTQWHTWGVIWTPTTITYTVDGRAWGQVTNTGAIPTQAMTLDLQQQTWCGSDWACPSAPQQLDVDWVAEYSYNA